MPGCASTMPGCASTTGGRSSKTVCAASNPNSIGTDATS